jgi:phage protein D/phage baseplate assembly protein gpV
MPLTASVPSTAAVKVDGSDLDPVAQAQMESALVVDRLAMPDMFTLVFRDPDRDILGKAKLEIGKAVEISATSQSDDAEATLIKGEVTSVEADYDTLGARAIVRGYDKSHRLAAGRKTKTYVNAKLSDIAKQVAGDAGLDTDVDETDLTIDHVFQVNQSDLDFLYAIALRSGSDCRVDGDKLLFKKPPKPADAPKEGEPGDAGGTTLVWGVNLVEFRARMSAVAQVSEVQVRGWDPKAKEAVIGKGTPTASNADLAMSPTDLADKVGGQKMIVVDHPVSAQADADVLATSRGNQVGSAAFEATAVAIGDPKLKAGTPVSVSGVDPALSGKWTISGSRHEFNNGAYHTALEFTGRQDRSILGLVTQGVAARERYYGVVIGIVTKNDDTEDKLARVKVKFPWLADDAESNWARVAAPGAAMNMGITWLPSVGDEVLCAFEHGDIDHPVVLGGLWNGTDTVPFSYDNDLDQGTVTKVSFISRTGHKVMLVESSSDSRIELLTANGEVDIVLDDKGKELKITSSGKVAVTADGDVSLKAGGSMKIEASGDLTLKGSSVKIN